MGSVDSPNDWPTHHEAGSDESGSVPNPQWTQAKTLVQQAQYRQAIQVLERCCQSMDPADPDWVPAQMLLAQTYQANGQLAEAKALADQLMTAQSQQTQVWAQAFLAQLLTIASTSGSSFNPAPSSLASTGIGAALSQLAADATEDLGEDVDYRSLDVVQFKPKDISEFREYSRIHLLPALKILEKQRKSTIRSITIATGIWSGIIIATVILGFRYPIVLLGGLLIGLGGWVFCYDLITSGYGPDFKYSVIHKIIEFLDPDGHLKYSSYPPTLNGTKVAFLESTLFGADYPTQFREDDCVYGRIGDTEVYFSEVCAESESVSFLGVGVEAATTVAWYQSLGSSFLSADKDRSDGLATLVIANIGFRLLRGLPFVIRRVSQGRRLNFSDFMNVAIDTDTTQKTLFKGLFFRAGFNKNFQGRTIIFPNGATRFLGPLGDQLLTWNKQHGQLVKLEDPEFRKYFVVYGDDQVEARYILSTSLMDKLVTFRRKADRAICISFVGQRIYIAIRYEEDLFEPKLYESMTSFDPIREYFELFQMMLSIVEDLKLNRRIWAQDR